MTTVYNHTAVSFAKVNGEEVTRLIFKNDNGFEAGVTLNQNAIRGMVNLVLVDPLWVVVSTENQYLDGKPTIYGPYFDKESAQNFLDNSGLVGAYLYELSE